jgi:hypothetical protein
MRVLYLLGAGLLLTQSIFGHLEPPDKRDDYGKAAVTFLEY